LAPLIVIIFILAKISTIVLILVAILNALIGGILGINQSFLRAIIAYSSITHIGWITILLTIKLSIQSLIYFILYAILILPIFIIFHLINSKTLTHINSSLIKWNFIIYLLPILMLSLGGLPPLLGFFPKFIVIYSTSQDSIIFLSILIIGALINLYFYLNITFSIILTITHSNNKSLNLISINPTLFFIVLATFFIFPIFILYALTLFY
jgi:NADH-ubiquinone oxidoreductase chain 2